MDAQNPGELIRKLAIPLGVCVAYHESGHVLLHWLTGEPFDHLSIIEQAGSLGHVGKAALVNTCPLRRKRPWEPLPGRYRPREWDNEVRDREDRIVSIQLAGAAAETILTGRRVHPVGNDRQTACEVGLLAGGDWRGARLYLKSMAHGVEKLLRADWWRVQRVASELLKRNVLSFHQVDRLCRGLCIGQDGGDVDGYSTNPEVAHEGSGLAWTSAAGGEEDLPVADRAAAFPSI
jgi:hypothetical protein